jgi:hypothetical protein
MTLFGVFLCVYFSHPQQPVECTWIGNERGFPAMEQCDAELERLKRLAAHGMLPLDQIESQGSINRMRWYTKVSCREFQVVN